MARPIWSGTVSFGLVSVPVRLYSAVDDHTIHFQQYERDTSDRIRYRRVNERTGKEVDYDDVVKGRETGGKLVQVESDELDEIAPGRSRAIEIDAFVDIEEIDPIYVERTYWLAPGADDALRPYQLLLRALEKTNRAGIATFAMKAREYLAAVRAHDDLLHLTTLHFDEDIRDPDKELPDLPATRKPRGKELDMAVTLIESMSEHWRPGDYEDSFNDRVRRLLANKRRGKKTRSAPEPRQATEPSDLYDVLSRSVDESKGRKNGRGRSKTPADLTRGELDKLARKLDIRGRSKMSKAELAEAVEEAGKQGSRRAS